MRLRCSRWTRLGCINTTTQESTIFEPFYSLRHSGRIKKQECYWLARRRPSHRPNDEGTDMFLSLVDLSMRPISPEGNIVSIRTTCTNRDLPSRLSFGNEDGDFELEGGIVMKRIVALRKPTAPVRPSTGKSALWRLISHLSINYLSLVEEGQGAPAANFAALRYRSLHLFAKRDRRNSGNPKSTPLRTRLF